jgi:hypothetical protein
MNAWRFFQPISAAYTRYERMHRDAKELENEIVTTLYDQKTLDRFGQAGDQFRSVQPGAFCQIGVELVDWC